MSVIGDKNFFAIDLDYISGSSPSFVELTIWISGLQLGTSRDRVYIGQLKARAGRFLIHRGVRRLAESESKSAETLFKELYDRFMITAQPGQTIEEAIELSRGETVSYKIASHTRDVFYLDEVLGSQMLDQFNILLIDELEQSHQGIIWRDLSSMKIFQMILPAFYIDNIFDEVRTQLDTFVSQ